MNTYAVEFVLDWIDRMTTRFGSVVRDKDGPDLDWGQALCREVYGPDWNRLIQGIDEPTLESLEVAVNWEEGATPDWVAGYGNGFLR